MGNILSFDTWDYVAFIGFFVALSLIGFWAGRKERASKEKYFLAGKKLPWYVVGFSFIASNISSEHFIGMIGAAYIYGICMSMYSWMNVLSYSFLVWLFIPFLLSSKVFTTPEYLEYRYSKAMRQLFAIITVIVNIIAFLAAIIYGGGLALHTLFGVPFWLSVIIIGSLSGVWAIYGGLSSVAWSDFLTVTLMVLGGLLVTFLGLKSLSPHNSLFEGIRVMLENNKAETGIFAQAAARATEHISSTGHYNRLSIFQPADNAVVPWPFVIFGVFSISIWFNVLNQFMIQRVLGAKNRHHARMGIVLAGYLQILIPFIVVIPGLIMFAKHPDILLLPWREVKPAADMTFVKLVSELIPLGLRGLIMAGLFAAIQSTVASVLNSTATILTLDIYKNSINKNASDKKLVKIGIWISIIVLTISIIIGEFIGMLGESLFVYIQTLYAYFAPPFAAVFILGIFWKRTSSTGALYGVILGLAFGIALKLFIYYTPSSPAWLAPFPNQGILSWAFSVLVIIIVSLFSTPPRPEQVSDKFVFSFKKLKVFSDENSRWYSSVVLWWAIFAALIAFLVALFV